GPAVAAISANVAHPPPWHRSTRYPLTPTLSLDAVQFRPIAMPDEAAAVNPDGAVGGCASTRVICSTSLRELLPLCVSPPPLTFATFVTVAGAVLATWTVTVIAG